MRKKIGLKIIIRNIHYSVPSKNSIWLEVGEETKLLLDSALDILYVLVHTSQNQKTTVFSWPSNCLEIELQPRGWSHGKYAEEPWKGSELPPAS